MDESGSTGSLRRASDNTKRGRLANMLSRIIGLEEREARRDKHLESICCAPCHWNQESQLGASPEASGELLVDKQHTCLDGKKENGGAETHAGPRTGILWALAKRLEYLEEQLARETQERATLQLTVESLQRQLQELREERHSQHQRHAAIGNTMVEMQLGALGCQIRPVVDLRVSEWGENVLSRVNAMVRGLRRMEAGEFVVKPPPQASPLGSFHSQRAAALLDKQNHHHSGGSCHGGNTGGRNYHASITALPPKGRCTVVGNFVPPRSQDEKLVLFGRKNLLVSNSPDTLPLPSICSNSITTLHPGGILLKQSGNAPHPEGIVAKRSVFNPLMRGMSVSFSDVPDYPYPDCSSFRKKCSLDFVRGGVPKGAKGGCVSGTKTIGASRPFLKLPPDLRSRKRGERALPPSTVFVPSTQQTAADENFLLGSTATSDQQANLHVSNTNNKRQLPPPLDKDALASVQNEIMRLQLRKLEAQLASAAPDAAAVASGNSSVPNLALSANSSLKAAKPLATLTEAPAPPSLQLPKSTLFPSNAPPKGRQ
ncbi:putative protein kinase [Trypanosoma conorhini]|uniref:Uncharacterized protein n=1 Tax=Trypanosoma conorhini TaxID=83891 RepID=A0A3R7LLS8_9TRYP|nr:putative protein kinase [Trypanosoma conorhini]RNF16926.1 putative protein kinase [Trypanosoma conorhini]